MGISRGGGSVVELMNNEIWPPPPTIEPPTPPQPKKGNWLDYGATVSNVVGFFVLLLSCLFAVTGKVHSNPHLLATATALFLLGEVLALAGIILGIFEWRTFAGKISVVSSLVWGGVFLWAFLGIARP